MLCKGDKGKIKYQPSVTTKKLNTCFHVILIIRSMLRLIGLSDYRLMYQYPEENISSNAIVCIFDDEIRIQKNVILRPLAICV